MSTRNFSGRKVQLLYEVDNLTAIYEPTGQKMWEPQHVTTLWASMACDRDSFTLFSLSNWRSEGNLFGMMKSHSGNVNGTYYLACSVNQGGFLVCSSFLKSS
jgi:hypothetical protein